MQEKQEQGLVEESDVYFGPIGPDRYPPMMRRLHWVMALLVIGLLAAGVYMTDLPREAEERATFYSLHKSFGVVVLILVFLRIIARVHARLYEYLPAVADVAHGWERWLAGAVHLSLYLCLLIQPITGYWMSNAYGFPVMFFGLKLPQLFSTDPAMGAWMVEVHGWIGYSIMALLGLHVLGVFKHALFDRSHPLRRML